MLEDEENGAVGICLRNLTDRVNAEVNIFFNSLEFNCSDENKLVYECILFVNNLENCEQFPLIIFEKEAKLLQL